MRAVLFGTCAAAALYAGLSQAQPIPEVIITGRLEEELPQLLADVGVRVETIASEDLVNGGYYEISQALQMQLPGMYIAARGGAFDYVQVSLQGSRTSDILWLVDGVRINNRLYAGTTPVDTIPAHMIERIEVLEGGQALFYGTQAIAGAINIVTKSFSETPDGVLSLGVDTNDGRHISGHFRDTIGGNHQFVIYGSSDQADGFHPFRKGDQQPSSTDRNRSYDVVTLGGKYGVDLGDAARFSVSYQHTDAKLDHAQPKFVAEAYNQRDEDILSAKFDYAPNGMTQFFLKGYYHWWDATYTEFDNATIPPSGSLDVIDDRTPWWYHDYGFNALGRFDTGSGFEIYGGYDYQSYVGQDDVLQILKRTETVHAPFAQIRTSEMLSPDASFAFGVRHNMPSKGKDATVWNASGQWDISHAFFARGQLGTAFRLPTAEELFAVDSCCTLGNPNLKPEESFNLNASLGGHFHPGMGMAQINWELIGFARNVKNLIAADAFDVYQNIGGTVETRGFEVVLNGDINESFSAQASYTYASVETKDTNVQIPDTPKTLAKLGVDFHPMTMPFGLGVNVSHVGNIYRNVGSFGRQNYGNYAVVDVAGRVFLDEDRRHRISARAENVFDQVYATRVRSTTTDGGVPYVYWHVGTPQTFHLEYTYNY